ncbi:transcriptional regulator GlxA family with amidase domain [Sphingobium sp. JAI105]|uniref:GlxA family transcriptional regulator n=1 Tax=Sphingobium sp. JAI105 TaxID=2787715 RepID=UPI0018CA9A31|nr:transcriptional regulator GlxA family with amidase domain [Sphingobium sp. JAI105]
MRDRELDEPPGPRQRVVSASTKLAAPRPYVVGFLLPPEFILLSYAAAVEPMRAANTRSGRKLFDWKVITADGQPVSSLCGGSFKADFSINDDIVVDMLLVSSPSNSAKYRDETVFKWLRHMARKDIIVGGFSGGVWLLARAGLLENHKCAVHWEKQSAFLEEFPTYQVTRSIYEIDRNRITCGGGLSTIDMMHEVIKARYGNEIAADVSEWLVHTEYGQRPQRPSLQTRMGVSHPGLIRALEAMEGNLEEPLSRAELAKIAGVSERQLNRLFDAQVGKPLSPYYLQLRLRRAYELIIQSNMTLLEIAMACGFNRASTFSKCYRRVFGVSPREERADEMRRRRPKD